MFVAPTNAPRRSRLRRWVLWVPLAAVSAVLATILARSVMPSAPTAYTGGGPAARASQAAVAKASAEPSTTAGSTTTAGPSTTAGSNTSTGSNPTPGASATRRAAGAMCYVNTDGVRYRAEPNPMAASYGRAHKGQAFAVERYLRGADGSRWAFGDLRGARMNVYLPAARLSC